MSALWMLSIYLVAVKVCIVWSDFLAPFIECMHLRIIWYSRRSYSEGSTEANEGRSFDHLSCKKSSSGLLVSSIAVYYLDKPELSIWFWVDLFCRNTELPDIDQNYLKVCRFPFFTYYTLCRFLASSFFKYCTMFIDLRLSGSSERLDASKEELPSIDLKG